MARLYPYKSLFSEFVADVNDGGRMASKQICSVKIPFIGMYDQGLCVLDLKHGKSMKSKTTEVLRQVGAKAGCYVQYHIDSKSIIDHRPTGLLPVSEDKVRSWRYKATDVYYDDLMWLHYGIDSSPIAVVMSGEKVQASPLLDVQKRLELEEFVGVHRSLTRRLADALKVPCLYVTCKSKPESLIVDHPKFGGEYTVDEYERMLLYVKNYCVK